MPKVEDQIAAAIRRVIRAVDLHSRKLLEECGLTAPQLATLRELERTGDTSIGVLARAIHLSQPTLTGIIDRLERRGLIRRTRDGEDRRAVKVAVTSAGRELLSRAPHSLHARFRREFEKLRDWEQTLMLSSLQRLADMMDAGPAEAAPGFAFVPVAEPESFAAQTASSESEPPGEARPQDSMANEKEVLNP